MVNFAFFILAKLLRQRLKIIPGGRELLATSVFFMGNPQ